MRPASWEVVSEGHRFTEGPVANEKGELFFTDIPNNRIHKVSADGKARCSRSRPAAPTA